MKSASKSTRVLPFDGLADVVISIGRTMTIAGLPLPTVITRTLGATIEDTSVALILSVTPLGRSRIRRAALPTFSPHAL